MGPINKYVNVIELVPIRSSFWLLVYGIISQQINSLGYREVFDFRFIESEESGDLDQMKSSIKLDYCFCK